RVAGFEPVEERSRFILNARSQDSIHKVTLRGLVPGATPTGLALQPGQAIDDADARPASPPQLKREIGVGFLGTTIVLRLPERTADRIARSAPYRRVVRPSARWMLRRLRRPAPGAAVRSS